MPTPSNPRASANRRVMNSVHARLYALKRDLETGTVSGNPLVLGVILECLQTLEAGQATDRRHQEAEGVRHDPQEPRKPLRIESRSVVHELQGTNAATVSVQQELHSLRRLADGYHQRLAKIEAYLGEEAGWQDMDAPVTSDPMA